MTLIRVLKLHKLFFSLAASQPPTTIPPPTTEVVETTTVAKKIVNFAPPISQTTMFTINAFDKGENESFLQLCKIFFNFIANLGNKYQSPSMNEIENSEQKLTDTAKSVDWSDIEKTNKGNFH
jgi:hypothetical protein